jgi:hypothetical protein
MFHGNIVIPTTKTCAGGTSSPASIGGLEIVLNANDGSLGNIMNSEVITPIATEGVGHLHGHKF